MAQLGLKRQVICISGFMAMRDKKTEGSLIDYLDKHLFIISLSIIGTLILLFGVVADIFLF